ncbi:unnamed protein product [Brassica oleracea]
MRVKEEWALTRVRIWLISPPRVARLDLNAPSSHSHRHLPPSPRFAGDPRLQSLRETTEPPRDHRSSTLPCLPVGELNHLNEISSAYESPETLDKQDESHRYPPLHPRYRRRRASSS